MVFDEKDWKRRLGKAQTQEEFSALIMELPERGPPETKKESQEDGREFYSLEGRTPVRCMTSGRSISSFQSVFQETRGTKAAYSTSWKYPYSLFGVPKSNCWLSNMYLECLPTREPMFFSQSVRGKNLCFKCSCYLPYLLPP